MQRSLIMHKRLRRRTNRAASPAGFLARLPLEGSKINPSIDTSHASMASWCCDESRLVL